MAVFGPHCGIWALQSVGVTIMGPQALHGSWAPELTMARVARLARVARVCGPRCPELCGTPVPQPEIRPVSPEWKMDSPPLDGQGGPCERSLEMRAWRPREGPWVGQGLRS